MNLLVIRFSAMGDVALISPALIAVASTHPNVRITLVTRGNFSPFFYNIPNVHVLGVNLKKYNGISGIVKLFFELKSLGPFHKIIDLHSSLRSRLISLLFWFVGVKSYKIIKGRREKLLQTKKHNKVMVELPHTVDRYLNVFQKAGFAGTIRKGPWINVDPESKLYAKEFFKTNNVGSKKHHWLGFAPFAGHKLKQWPLDKAEQLVRLLRKQYPESSIFLFGSKAEVPMMEKLKGNDTKTFIVSGGKLGIKGELGIMEKIDLLVGMDSSNIHIASLLKIPVLALFGTTHPWSGFAPYGQEKTGVIQMDLDCRPCSIYGNTVCLRKDFACIERILPQDVLARVREKLL